ncbi:MAG: universal stress protein [candidate division WOR-3 bacterium]
MFGKIIWTTDLSENAKASLPYAEEIASRFDADLILVHVILDIPLFYASFIGDSSAYLSAMERARAEASSEMENMARNLRNKGVAARIMLLEGSPYTEVVRFAETEGADLVVMSTRGISGLERLILGSTTEKVVRNSPCPVLTVHKQPELPLKIRNILLLTDLSELSKKAFRPAVELTGAFGAKLTLLHVMEPGVPLSREDEKILADALVGVMNGLLQDITGEEFRDEIERVVLKANDAAGGVARFCEENPVDLIVMATHGRTGLRKTLLGSVAEKILRNVEIPVLTVRVRP